MKPTKRKTTKRRKPRDVPDVMVSGFSMHGLTPKRRAAFQAMSDRAAQLRREYNAG